MLLTVECDKCCQVKKKNLAQLIGTSRVIVQSDCLLVVETMGNEGFSAPKVAAIYYDESYSL